MRNERGERAGCGAHLHGSKWNLPSSPKPKAHSNVANDEGSCTREKSSASATLTSSSDALQICFRSTSTGNVETTSSRLPPSQGPFAGFTCGGLGLAEGYLTGAEGWGATELT